MRVATEGGTHWAGVHSEGEPATQLPALRLPRAAARHREAEAEADGKGAPEIDRTNRSWPTGRPVASRAAVLPLLQAPYRPRALPSITRQPREPLVSECCVRACVRGLRLSACVPASAAAGLAGCLPPWRAGSLSGCWGEGDGGRGGAEGVGASCALAPIRERLTRPIYASGSAGRAAG